MPFTPLETYMGLTLEELNELIKERDIYIWGCGHLGKALLRCFNRNGLIVKAFCDNNLDIQDKTIEGIMVLSPYNVLNEVKRRKGFLILASSNYIREMDNECIRFGLRKHDDYITYLRIKRPEAVINISGKCEIKCANCPQGNFRTLRQGEYITFTCYEKVLKKLLREIPLLLTIELSKWADPLLNPDIPDIIRITEEYVPCSLSTSLQSATLLEEVIKAQPSLIKVCIQGYDKSYEFNSEGASWQTLL